MATAASVFSDRSGATDSAAGCRPKTGIRWHLRLLIVSVATALTLFVASAPTASAAIDDFLSFPGSFGYLSEFGTSGHGDGQFSGPVGVAVDSSGDVYVADEGNSRVEKFDPTGNYVSQIGSGIASSAAGQLNFPFGVAVDSSGDVFVADTANNRVQTFDATGAYVSQF